MAGQCAIKHAALQRAAVSIECDPALRRAVSRMKKPCAVISIRLRDCRRFARENLNRDVASSMRRVIETLTRYLANDFDSRRGRNQVKTSISRNPPRRVALRPMKRFVRSFGYRY
jgi:hypothetical protein